MNDIIGTCSICGGEVVGPRIWHGIMPPPINCSRCGAVPMENTPVIPMMPAPRGIGHIITTTGTNIEIRGQVGKEDGKAGEG